MPTHIRVHHWAAIKSVVLVDGTAFIAVKACSAAREGNEVDHIKTVRSLTLAALVECILAPEPLLAARP
jgi:hypothetical protein